MDAITSKEFAQIYYDTMLEKHKNPDKHRGLCTGISQIEQLLGGFKLGWSIIVGGPEKSGKTTLMMHILLQIAMGAAKNQGLKWMWVSQEMSNEDMGDKVFANLTDEKSPIDVNTFRDVKLKENDWPEMTRIRDLVSTFDGYWATGAPYIEDVFTKADSLGIDILVLDYLQLFSSRDMKSQAGTPGELSHISKRIRQWALDKETTKRDLPRLTITGSQLSRDATQGKIFNSANYFKSSSSIEQDASVAFTIGPVTDPSGEEDPTKKIISVVASRHSGKDSFMVGFDGAKSRFGNLETVDLNQLSKQYLSETSPKNNTNKSKRTETEKALDALVEAQDFEDGDSPW